MRTIPLLSLLILFVFNSVFAEANPCLDPLLVEVQNERPRTMSNRQFARYQALVAECKEYRLHPPVDTASSIASDSAVVVPQQVEPGTLSPSIPDTLQNLKKSSPPKRKRRSALPWVALGIGGTGTLLTTMVYTSITDECDGITDIFGTEEECREGASKDREALLPFLIGFVGLALVGLVSVIGSSSPK